MNAISVVILWTNLVFGYSIKTCRDCIQIPSALWCSHPKSIDSSRCFVPEFGPASKWILSCKNESFVYQAPDGFFNIVLDEPFSHAEDSNLDDVVQIKPQKVKLGLSAGQSQTVRMKFKYVTDYSLGLYYLMDLSKSMDVDRKTILSLADTLVFQLKKLTPYFRLGFGTFLDKIKLPYVNTHSQWLQNPCTVANECRAPYGFQNILSLTNDTDAFINSVKKAKLSTNWDDPEGGFDALMQVMACDSVGWDKKKTRHLIVYVSDSAFKYAGDGKLAGLTTDNDMRCHLDENGMYTHSTLQDYPSVSQIQKMSHAENMYIIFAVKKKVFALYDALTDLVIQSEASLLSDDSSNIIDIITDYYMDISKTLKLKISISSIAHVKVNIRAKCEEDQDWIEDSSLCHDVDVNKEIQFDITFELKKCPENGESITIIVSPEGLPDKMTVEIDPLCQCSCEADSVPNATVCSERGTLECGVCLCNDGYSGELCECQFVEPSIDESRINPSCRSVNDSSGKDCNGRGTCLCDKCQCDDNIDEDPYWKFQGEFCEFSNFDCPRNKEGICSNNGLCDHSRCVCKEGWSKEDCSCDLATDKCISSHLGYPNVCDGHGDCVCNQCRCHLTAEVSGDYFFGQFCEDCQNCTGRCDSYELLLRQPSTNAIGDEIITEITLDDVPHTRLIYVDELIESENVKICRMKRENGCTVRFSYDPRITNLIFVETELCPQYFMATQTLLMVIIAAIVTLSVVVLLLWKLWVTRKDKREYEKFLIESKDANFIRADNPLYKDPITRIINPLHDQTN